MGFQPVPDTAEFVMVHIGPATQRVQSTIYVRNSLGWPSVRLSATGTTIGNAWRDQVMPLLSSTIRFDKVEARDIGAQFGAQAVVEYDRIGDNLVDATSLALAALVQLNGSGGAAPRQGRLFVGGITEDVLSQDTLSPAFRTSLLTAVNAIDSSIAGGGDAWVIVSRSLKTATSTPPRHLRPVGVTNTVASRAVRPLVATQRDRRLGIGS